MFAAINIRCLKELRPVKCLNYCGFTSSMLAVNINYIGIATQALHAKERKVNIDRAQVMMQPKQ